MVKRLLAAAAGLVLLLLAVGLRVVAASLPRRAGEAPLPGLDGALSVALDSRAIATVRGESFLDALRGQGYLHAQERFFQMDLLRRSSAGELAELFGERALAADRGQRPFGYRERARQAARDAAGRAERLARRLYRGCQRRPRRLGRAPARVLARRRRSRGRGSPRTALLVVLTFYTMLSNNDSYERAQGVMHAVLPPPLYDFLTPSTSRFDRPVLGASPERPDRRLCAAADPGARSRRLAAAAAPPSTRAARVEPPLIGARVE